jgi:hypothetical protein
VSSNTITDTPHVTRHLPASAPAYPFPGILANIILAPIRVEPRPPHPGHLGHHRYLPIVERLQLDPVVLLIMYPPFRVTARTTRAQTMQYTAHRPCLVMLVYFRSLVIKTPYKYLRHSKYACIFLSFDIDFGLSLRSPLSRRSLPHSFCVCARPLRS